MLFNSLSRLNIDFKQLAVFLDLCQTQSITETAHRTGRTKSQVSGILSQLESKTDLVLVERQHKHIHINEQGLALSKHCLLLANIHNFTQTVSSQEQADLRYLHLVVPIRACSGQVSQALFFAIEACREQYPNLFIHVEFVDSYAEHSQYQPQWVPPWASLGNIALHYDAAKAQEGNLYQSPWLLLSQKGSGLGDKVSVKDLQNKVIILPRMPWQALAQVVSFCEANHLSFEHSSDDYSAYSSMPLGKKQWVLIPGMFVSNFLKNVNQMSVLDEGMSHSLNVSQEGDHPAIDFVCSMLKQAMGMQKQDLPLFQPSASLKQWAYLDAIFKSNSLSKACEKVFITQPALSNQIKNLEKILGVTLFHRKMGDRLIKRNQVSDLFEILVQAFEAEVQVFESIIAKLRLDKKDELCLGILPSVDRHSRLMDLIINKVDVWGQKHPNIRLNIVEERHLNIIHSLRTQQVHIAITEADAPWVTQIPFEKPELVGLVFKKTAAEIPDSLTWEEVQSYPLVLPRKATGMRRIVDTHCLKQGFELVPQVESDSLNINQRWLIEGRYATLLPRSAVESLVRKDILAFVPLYPSLNRVLKLTYLSNRILSPLEKDLINALIQG